MEITPAYAEIQGTDMIKYHFNLQNDITLEKNEEKKRYERNFKRKQCFTICPI